MPEGSQGIQSTGMECGHRIIIVCCCAASWIVGVLAESVDVIVLILSLGAPAEQLMSRTEPPLKTHLFLH